MKRLLLTLLIGISALTAFGQNKEGTVSERYFEAKVREFVYRLHMSDEQKALFVPIYRRYSEEMSAAVGQPQERMGQKPVSSEEAAALAKARIERQQAAQAIRLKYVDEFSAVLDPDQMGRLYETESQIQRKLLRRKNEHHGSGQHPSRGRSRK